MEFSFSLAVACDTHCDELMALTGPASVSLVLELVATWQMRNSVTITNLKLILGMVESWFSGTGSIKPIGSSARRK
jgi:hypothetical protein